MTTPIAIDIVNLSTVEGLGERLPDIVAALGTQLARDVQPFWGRVLPALRLTASPSPEASLLVLLDDADQANALGYHDETPEGQPYARVFVRTILDNGGTIDSSEDSVSVCLSHELLEMVGDPACNVWADAFDGWSYALELADAVEGDAYSIDGVSVSNFVLPSFFDPRPILGGRYDFLSRLTAPFTMTAGGYQIRRHTSGEVSNVYANGFPAWKRELKEHPAARTMRRCQAPKPHRLEPLTQNDGGGS